MPQLSKRRRIGQAMDSRSSCAVAESPDDDSASPIHSLSDDLLTSILRLVLAANPTASDTSTSDISTGDSRPPYQVALVCKRWSRVASLTVLSASSAASSAASFSPKHELLSRRLEQALRKFPNLTRLHLDSHTIDFIDDRFLCVLGLACPNMTYLFLGKVRLPVRPPLVDAVSEAGLASVFRGYRRLEHVSVHCAPNIKALPASLLDLSALRRLQLEAPSLKLFPEVSRGRLSTLRDLRLLSCNALPCLPDSLGNLAGLTHLRVEKSDNLEQLPDSLCDLQLLDVLVICSCYWLTSLPDDLGQLPPPVAMRSMMRLERLVVEECCELVALRLPVGEGVGCASLRALPASLTALAELERLVVTRCTALQWAPGNVAHMQGLRELRPDGCRTVLLPSSLVCLGRLDRLIVMGEVGEGMGMAMGDINGSMDGGGSTSSGCVTTMEGAADRCSTRASGSIDGAAMVADTLSKGGSSKGSAAAAAAAAAASKAAAGGGGGGGGERGAAVQPIAPPLPPSPSPPSSPRRPSLSPPAWAIWRS
ncbi:unnamed protein product [Closterium sp. NIES-64]|nr:unnamed protein product [Closterium sp. NIES-64]